MWNPFRKKDEVFGKYKYVNFKEPALASKEFLPEEESVWTSDVGTEQSEQGQGDGLDITAISASGKEVSGNKVTNLNSDIANQKLNQSWQSDYQKTVDGGTDFNKGAISAPGRLIVRGLLLALTFLVPLFFLPFTAPGDVLVFNKQVLIFGLTLAGFAIWLTIVVRQGGLVLQRSGLEWGVLAVGAASLVSSIFSSQVFRSFLSGSGFLTVSSLAMFFFLALNFFEKKDIGKIVNVFIASVSLAVFASLLNLFGLPIFKWISWISYKDIIVSSQFNTVGSPVALGSLAVLALVLAISSYFKLGNSEGNTFKLISGLILALFLIVLNLWSLFVVLAIGMLGVILAPSLAQREQNQKIKLKTSQLVVPLVILVLSGVFALSSKYLDFGLSGALLKEKPAIEASLSQRGSLDIAIDSLKSKPVFGFGSGNYSLAYDQFKPEPINSTLFWNSHFGNSVSEFFNLATEGGVVAVAALTFLFFLILRSIWRHTGEMTSAFMAVLALFFFFPFNLATLFGFWLLVSLTAVHASSGREGMGYNSNLLTADIENAEFSRQGSRITSLGPPTTSSSSVSIKSNFGTGTLKVKMDDASFSSIFASLIFVLVLVLGLIGGYLLIQKYRGEVYFAQAARISGNGREELNQMVSLVSKAVSADKNNTAYLNALANLLLRHVGLDINDKEGKPEELKKRIEDNTKTVIQIANQITISQKNNSASWFNAGLIYENLMGFVGGADEAALTAYQEFLKRAPKDPSGFVRVGNIYLLRADETGTALRNAKSKGQEIKNEEDIKAAITKDYKNAEDNFKKAIELKGDLATALYNLGTVYEREARLKEAVKQLELTRLLDQNNPGLAFELGLLYYRDNQKDKALVEMARAVNLFKDYSNARWYLALMLEEKGEIDLAIAQLQEILKLEANKDNQVVLEKMAALGKGKREFPPGKITSKKPLEPQTAQPR